ncbi:hypothetical protein BX600DRAFT_448992 [Xylariales sp. PMI_506]|nr:hypothetical protein BX600DRAFT_448992 [Xylariales sp. PMI_506]
MICLDFPTVCVSRHSSHHRSICGPKDRDSACHFACRRHSALPDASEPIRPLRSRLLAPESPIRAVVWRRSGGLWLSGKTPISEVYCSPTTIRHNCACEPAGMSSFRKSLGVDCFILVLLFQPLSCRRNKLEAHIESEGRHFCLAAAAPTSADLSSYCAAKSARSNNRTLANT